jgi:hypothetical protein
MEMNNRVGIPMGGRIQLDPVINVDTLKLNPACKVIARALQEYGSFNGDYAGATVLYADNSPSALKQWKGVLQKTDFLATFTPAFIKKYFRLIEMGNLLPGQNLKDGQIGFIDFSFPGAVSVSIDWLHTTIECVVDASVSLTDVKPVFKTAREHSLVYIKEVKQESGKSVVTLNRDVL